MKYRALFRFLRLVTLYSGVFSLFSLVNLSLPVSAYSDESASEETFPVRDNPGSIIASLDQAEKERDYLFQLPGTSGPMKSWSEWKTGLNEKYGIRFLLEWAALYQKASTTLTTEDEAAGYDLEFNGTWTFWGKDTPTYSMLGLGIFHKGTMGTDFSPLTLFTQYGSLYPGGTAYGEDGYHIYELRRDGSAVTFDGRRLLIPNRKIWAEIIENRSVEPLRRADIVVKVGFDEDINRVIDVLYDLLRNEGRVLDHPEARVFVTGWKDSWAEVAVRPWTRKRV